MSRPSASSLSVVQVGGRVRLAVPDELTPEQGRIWQAVVDSKPVEWFDLDGAPLLKEYVRAAAMTDWLDVQVQAATAGDDVGVLDKLMRLRDLESKRVASIATKLRLTQQSRYTPQAAATATHKAESGAKPWQFGTR